MGSAHARPTLLDLYCGAGGCSVGYHRAGFDVIGVDVKPQPNYPFEFHQADALEFTSQHGSDYNAIHASPPCQAYTAINRSGKLKGKEYPDLVAETRRLLEASGRPWVIENVPGAPLRSPALLCGSAFGLAVRRHRIFESSFLLLGTQCRHHEQDRPGPRFPACFRSRKSLRENRRHLSTVVQVYGHTAGKHLWPEAMGIDWMTAREMTQAIPPAYTQYIGTQLMRILENQHDENTHHVAVP
jgi:DNA (cytosine-5)-methyltransferase 1